MLNKQILLLLLFVTFYCVAQDYKTQIADYRVVVTDFHKAYNPYCAFASGYAYPKQPDENRLGLSVKAGKKLFAEEKNYNQQ